MKKFISYLLAFVMVLTCSITAFAHSGRTDSSGGHRNNKTGGYHYHCGGHPAHSHPNGICPYNSTSSSTTIKFTNNNKTTKSAGWYGDRYWNGKKYVKGRYVIDNKIYYFNSKGRLYESEWVEDSNNIYYVNKKGIVSTGWQTIGNKTYYFGNNGKMRTGLKKIDGNIYYFGNDGAIRKGWVKITGNKYYFRSNGVRAEDTILKIDGKTYKFDKNGQVTTSSKKTNSNGTLKFGMTQQEVIESKNLECYAIDNELLYTTNKRINDCYMFDNNSLCAYGKKADYSEDTLFDFQIKLSEDGWEYLSEFEDDDGVHIYYIKDSHITAISYNQNLILQLKFSDKYIKGLLDL